MSLSLRMLWLSGAVIALAVAGLWSGEPLAGCWRWPAALLLLTAAWERYRLPAAVGFVRTVEPTIPLGQQARYRLLIANESGQPITVDYQPHYPPSLTGDADIRRRFLAAGETAEDDLHIIGLKLGPSELGPLYVRMLGGYGLLWWNRRIDDRVALLVEPDRLDRSCLAHGLSAAGKRKTQQQSVSGYDLLNLRDYRYGDSMHGVDWKATARRRQPMVRVFQREQRLETAILVDCGRGANIQYQLLDRLHHFVNVAARLSEYAVANGDQVACIAYAAGVVARSPMAGGAAALQAVRSVLSELTPRFEESNPLALALELSKRLRHRSLVVFLTEMEHWESSGQLRQAVHLLCAKHHVLVASLEDDDIRLVLKQSAKHWLTPYRHFAALEFLRGRELTRRELSRAGVSVVAAPARQIDDELLRQYRRLRERSAV